MIFSRKNDRFQRSKTIAPVGVTWCDMAPSPPRFRRNRCHFCCHRRSPNPGATSRWFPRTRSPSTRQHKGDQHGSNYGKLWKTMENCGSRSILIQPNKIRMMEKLRMIIGPTARQSFQLLICLLYIYISTVSTCIDMSCIQCICVYIYIYIHNCIYMSTVIHSNPILKCLFHGSHGASQHTNTHRHVTW